MKWPTISEDPAGSSPWPSDVLLKPFPWPSHPVMSNVVNPSIGFGSPSYSNGVRTIVTMRGSPFGRLGNWLQWFGDVHTVGLAEPSIRSLSPAAKSLALI